MKDHHYFFALMAISSAISLLKSAVLAAILVPTDFAHYSATFALVAAVASAISFGLTEGMVKRFTRLVAFGRPDELRATLGSDVRKLAWRYLPVLLLAPACLALAFGSDLIIPAASIVILAFATNNFAISSSLFRAYDNLMGLGLSTALRSALALLFAAAFCAFYGWREGLIAEALSSALIAIAILYYFRARIQSGKIPVTARPDSSDQFVSRNSDGFWLFVAFAAALIPASFDRLWVVKFAPAVDAAQYAFCGIWIGAAYTVASIYVQKFGPDMIRMKAANASTSLLAVSLRHAAVLSAFLVCGAAASFVLVYLIWPDAYWAKYQLSLPIVLLTLAALAVQVSPIFDWALIALDGERRICAASILSVVLFALAFGLCAYLNLGFSAYILSAFGARLLQIVAEIVLITGRERKAVAA